MKVIKPVVQDKQIASNLILSGKLATRKNADFIQTRRTGIMLDGIQLAAKNVQIGQVTLSVTNSLRSRGMLGP